MDLRALGRWTMAGAAGVLGMAGPVAGQCHHDVTVIKHQCSTTTISPTFAAALNDQNVVVGYVNYCVTGPQRPFVWTEEGGLQLIPLPQGASAGQLEDMNENGEMVGTFNVTGGFHAFFRGANGYVELPPAGNGGWSKALAINEHSVVVGTRNIGDGQASPMNAYTWSARDGFTDLGLLGGETTNGTGISDSGVVIGWIGTNPLASLGLIWGGTKVIEMGPVPGGMTSDPESISSHGTIVGSGRVPVGKSLHGQAFLWRDGSYTMLPRLPGYEGGTAVSVNALEVPAGASSRPEGNNPAHRAVIWLDGVAYDLNDLVDHVPGRSLEVVVDISDRGSMAIQGHEDFTPVSFLLTPRDRPVADVDGDCRVDRRDLSFVLRDWGTQQVRSDVNEDGVVDALDFLAVLAGWTLE